MWNRPELKDFIRVPMLFIQSGFPLKVSLFIYHPFEKKVALLKRKGEILDLDLMLVSKTKYQMQLVTLKDEYFAAMSYLLHDGAAYVEGRD